MKDNGATTTILSARYSGGNYQKLCCEPLINTHLNLKPIIFVGTIVDEHEFEINVCASITISCELV